MPFFFVGEGLHEFGHDLVLANELGVELLDVGLLRVIDGLGLASVGEGEMSVFKELFEPVVELVGIDVELIAEIGHGDFFDEMPLEDRDLLGIGEMPALLVRAIGAIGAV